MPTDPALPRRAGEPTLPHHAPLPSPTVQTAPPEPSDALSETSARAYGTLHQADVRQSLGAMGLVCRSVLACLLAIALGLAALLSILLLP
jgi:hypothetical protein